MDQNPSDTLAAIATASGPAAIAMVRLSGRDALAIARACLAGVGGRPLQEFKPRHAHLCELLDADGAAVDQVVVVWYPAPHSFTGEDVVEVSLHGGTMASRAALEQFLLHGARSAGPGEFTLRAFLGGRMDLAQAEAVVATVDAQTHAGLRLAHRQLHGALSERVRAVRAAALGALAQVEAAVDFPEDVDEPDRAALDANLKAAAGDARHLALESRVGRIYQDGIRLVIMGRPNVGKSSLLNALLREERAIVTPSPGTTRDLIEETLSIGGVPIRVVDTAGLRVTEDPVERIGVERALRTIQGADLCLLVLDRSEGLTPEDIQAVERTAGLRTLVVVNKCDLPAVWDWRLTAGGLELGGRGFPLDTWPYAPPVVEAAAALQEGIGRAESALLNLVFNGEVIPADQLHGGSVRHGVALEKAALSLELAGATARSGAPLDFISVDLRGALQALGEITGETAHEDLLHEIFSRFCIGK